MIADARKKAEQEEELVENERAFSNGFGGPATEAKEIHQENATRISKMSNKEIEEAQQSLFQMMSPETIAMLKRKGKKKTKPKSTGKGEQKQNTPSSSPALSHFSIIPSVDLSTLKTEEELLDIARNKKRSMLDRAKLDWTKDVAVPKTDRKGNQTNTAVFRSEVRFDLNGLVIKPNEDPQQLKGLHHHGRNSTSAGYALDELLHLSRSTHLQQRTMALKSLAGVLRQRAQALHNATQHHTTSSSSASASSSTRPSSIIPSVLPIETHAVLHMSLQHVASQHTNNTLLRVSINAMHAFLVPPHDEQERITQASNWSSSSVGHLVLPPMLHAQHTATLFRLDTNPHPKDEVDYLNTNRTTQSPKGTGEENEEEKEAAEAKRNMEHQKGSERPVYWLMRNGLLDHLSKIMKLCRSNGDQEILCQCLEILQFCARHSMLTASVMASSSIPSTLRDICLEVPLGSSSSSSSSSNGSNSSDHLCTVECLRLVRTLCASSRAVVERFQRTQMLDVVYKYLFTNSNELHVPIEVRIECLNILRICLEYHHDVMTGVRILIHGELYLCGANGSESGESDDQPSSSSANRLRITFLNVLETLCRSKSNGAEEENDQITHYIHSRMEWMIGIVQSNWGTSTTPAIVGSVFQVLAAAVESGRVENSHVERLLSSTHVLNSTIAAMRNGVVEQGNEQNGTPTNDLALPIYVLFHGIYHALCASTMSRQVKWTQIATGIVSATLQKWTSSTVPHGDLSDTRGYTQRPQIHTLLMMVEYLSMKHNPRHTSINNDDDVKDNQQQQAGMTREMLMNAALVMVPMLMPGDEHHGRQLLSDILFNIDHLKALWKSQPDSTAPATNLQQQHKELLELRTVLMGYYLSFFGDRPTLLRSVLRSGENNGTRRNTRKDTLFACPRIQGEQQSTLPLPSHWLYLPMAGEEEWSSINTMVASLTFLWKLEIHPVISSLGTQALNKQQKIFAILRVALSTDAFVFDTMSSTALANVLAKHEQEQTSSSMTSTRNNDRSLTIAQVCGRENCLALAAQVTKRYLEEPRCHTLMYYIHVMKWLLSTSYFTDSECRRSIWSVVVEARLGHSLENVYQVLDDEMKQHGNNNSTPDVTDRELVQLYATSLVDTIGKRREYCPQVYTHCLATVSKYVFGGTGEELKKNAFGRRQVGLSIVRGGNSAVLAAFLAYDVLDNKTSQEREQWLRTEE